MRSRIFAAGVAAIIAATSIAVSASFGPPVTSTSTLTLPSRDSVGVVVVYTSRCTTADALARRMKGDSLACPNAWDVVSLVGVDTVKFTRARATLRDTVRLARLVCPAVGVFTARVLPRSQGTVIDKPGVSRIALPCRPPNAAEIAFADSFPQANILHVLRSQWARKFTQAAQDSLKASALASALTAADSAAELAWWAAYALQADSVRLESKTPGPGVLMDLTIPRGYSFEVCSFARNKYSGDVINLFPNYDAQCEARRAEQQVNVGAGRSVSTGIDPDPFWKPPNRNAAINAAT